MQLSWIKEIQDNLAKSYKNGTRVQPRHTATQHFYEDTTDGEIYPSVTTMTSLLGKAIYKQIAANAAVDYIIAHQGDDDVFEQARQAHQVNLDQAGQWGTEAHDCVERYMQDWLDTGDQPLNIQSFFPDGMSNEAKSAALAGEKFMTEYPLFPIATEMKIVSKKHKFAGTLDSLWAVGGGTMVNDGCRHVWAEKSNKRICCMKCGRTDKLRILLGDWKSSNRVLGNTEYALQVAAYKYALHETTGIITEENWIIRLDKQKPQYEVYTVPQPLKSWHCFQSIRKVYDFYKEQEEPIVSLNAKKVIKL